MKNNLINNPITVGRYFGSGNLSFPHIIVHADDFGASRGVTDAILDAFDNGVLSSTSIIANGFDFDYAIAQYKRRKGFRLGVHLNLVEGKPILPREEVSMLVNKKGEFCHSFLSLYLANIFANRHKRDTLFEQVKNEFSAQILKVKTCFGKDFVLSIDSHQHLHMIPFVLNAILELGRDTKIDYIRMPQEALFFASKDNNLFRIYCGPNILKHFFLNLLSSRSKKFIRQKNIHCCDYFIGVLFSGYMTEGIARSALRRIPINNASNMVVEILFHPGNALPEEAVIWSGNKALVKHYSSLNRRNELQELKSESFRGLLQL